MFGKIRQRWNAFKADLEQYKKLRRDEKIAWQIVEQCRAKITADVKDSQKCCIRRNSMELIIDSDGGLIDLKPGIVEIIPYEIYCAAFKDNALNTDGDAKMCDASNCKHCTANKDYVHALNAYRTIRDARRNAWKKRTK